MSKKFASVGYTSLVKRIAREIGTTAQVKEPEMVDDLGIEDTEEEVDELDEAYEMRKLQFYAGIIK